jgi:hypothetical protein
MPRTVTDLQYEPSAAGRRVLVERDGDVTRIVVAMPGPYVPIPKWTTELDLFSLVVVPLWWIGSLFTRLVRHPPTPPRAVFEITADRFRMTLVDATTGEVHSAEWPRAAVAEARANRYERGLWIDVPGSVKSTYLADLPRDTIARLEAALAEALGRAPS